MDKPHLSKPTTSTVGHGKQFISADSKSKKRSNDSKISKQAAVTQDKDVLNRTGKKKRHNVNHGETTSKKHHEPVINNLIQQGWTVINHSRYQITVVKLPEDQPKLKTASTDKVTPIKKNTLEMNENKVDAPVLSGESHQKKTLLQRLVKRSRKVFGRFFTRGRRED